MQIKDVNNVDFSRVIKRLGLVIPAQSAKTTPPVGPILGQVKIKAKDFCTLFNDGTVDVKNGIPLPVVIFVLNNENYNFFVKTPTVTFLIQNCLKYNSSKELSLLDIYKISLIKEKDLIYLNKKAIFKNILNMAKILKVEVIN